MTRFWLYARSIVEALAAFFLLLIVPFFGIDLAHSHAPTTSLLLGFLLIAILFLLGLLLFRDAVQLRLRLQKDRTGQPLPPDSSN
jgi:TRAP-type C4-dicarboxylate transport system permease small subunit